jgi:hypothetical protein
MFSAISLSGLAVGGVLAGSAARTSNLSAPPWPAGSRASCQDTAARPARRVRPAVPGVRRVEGSTLGPVRLASRRRTGPPGTFLKPAVLFLTPDAERSNLDPQPAGLVFEYPRDPEHRSYSDRGEPGVGERTRADGHTGRLGWRWA